MISVDEEIISNNPITNFGRQYLTLACYVENYAGGDGPYGNQKVFFDSWAERKNFLPEVYFLPESQAIRKYAKNLGEASDEPTKLKFKLLLNQERRKFAEKAERQGKDLLTIIDKLEKTAKEIEDPIRRKTRIDQVNGLYALAHVLYKDLGFSGYCPTYSQIVEAMTGINPPMIPTRKQIDEQREYISGLLTKEGYSGFPARYSGQLPSEQIFTSQVTKWRKKLGLLTKEQMLETYQTGVKELIKSIKRKIPGFPSEATVEIVDASKNGHDRFVGGSFDYGRGGQYKAETKVVPDDTLSIIDVATSLVFHEIGGHYALSVLWDKYHTTNNDNFGAIGTMCSNIAITHEGFAGRGVTIYGPELVRIYGNKIAKNIFIAQSLEQLSVDMIPFEIRRKELGDITPSEMLEEFKNYGVTEARAKRRTVAIFEPSRWSVTLTYTGTSYSQGSNVIGSLIHKYGVTPLVEKCAEPISIAALELALAK